MNNHIIYNTDTFFVSIPNPELYNDCINLVHQMWLKSLRDSACVLICSRCPRGSELEFTTCLRLFLPIWTHEGIKSISWSHIDRVNP